MEFFIAILDNNFSDMKTTWQFSDNQKFRVGNCPPPSLRRCHCT